MKKSITIFLLMMTYCSYSQQIADFSLNNIVTGKEVSLSQYASLPGVVIIFTSSACPYDNYYAERIKKMSQECEGKIPFLLVNANAEPADAMRQDATKKGYKIPYLEDKDQILMQRLGATKSTEAFLLKNSGGKFSIFYHGAIDDNAQVEADVSQSYLKNAIETLLASKNVVRAEVRPVGCTIRKK